MFGKRNRGNPYYKPKLQGHNSSDDNIIVQTKKNKITTFTRQSTRAGGNYTAPGNTKIYNTLDGITDQDGDVIKTKFKVEFVENLFLWLNPTGPNNSANASDKSGNNLHGTFINNDNDEIIYDSDFGDYVYNFDGTNDYIELPRLSGNYFINNGFTFCGWVKNNDLSVNRFIFSFSINDWAYNIGDYSFAIHLFNNSSTLRTKICRYSGNTYNISNNNYFSSDEWVFISLTHFNLDSTTGILQIYKNGELISTDVGDSINFCLKRYNYIGKYPSGDPTYFNGQMNDLRWYNRALTSGEIRLIYENSIKNKLSRTITQLTPISDYIFLHYNPTSLIEIGGTVPDLSGNGLNGTLFNDTVVNENTDFSVSNSFYQIDFDGTNDYVSVPTLSGNFFASGFSFCGWVLYDTSSSWARVFDFGNSSANNNIVVARNSTSSILNCTIYNGGTAQTIINNSGYIVNDTWMFISVTSVSGSNKLYKNGSLVDSNTTSYIIQNVDRTSNYIGRSNWSSNSYFQGQMYDLRWYSTVLTSDQILNIYESTKNKFIYAIPYDGNLFLHYNPTSAIGTGGTVPDLSSNGLNGTLVDNAIVALNTSYTKDIYEFQFDGTDDYVSVPTLSGDFFANGFSFCGWVRYDTSSSWARIFDFGNGQGDNNIDVTRDGTSSKLAFEIFNGGTGVAIIENSGYIVNDTWMFISITSVSGSNKLYKNGTLIDSNTTTYTIQNVDRTSNYIGRSNFSVDSYFQGQMYDLHWYSRVLTPGEIYDLYTETYFEGRLFLHYNPTYTLTPNEKIPDLTISNLDGTLEGHTCVYYDKTIKQYLINFDGTTDYISVPTLSGDFFTNGFSFCGWININSLQDYDRFFTFGNSSTSNSYGIVFRMRTSGSGFKLDFVIYNSAGTGEIVTITTTTVFNLNQWYFVSVSATHDSSPYTYNIYVDGTLNYSNTDNDTYDDSIDRTFNVIGAKQTFDYAIDGQMYDLRWYSRVLSDQEINNIYRETQIQPAPVIPYSIKTNNLEKDLFIWIKTDDLFTTGQIKNAVNSGITVIDVGSGVTITRNQNAKPALYFENNNNCYVRLSPISKSHLTTGFTWAGWLNSRSRDNNDRVWHFGSTTGNNDLLGVLTEYSTYRLRIFDSSANERAYSIPESITDNTWYHVVHTIYYDQANTRYTLKSYFNGNFSYNGSYTTEFTYAYDFSSVDRYYNYIGLDNSGSGAAFFGAMADLRWYSRVLSDDEIYELYRSTYTDYIVPEKDDNDISKTLSLSPFSMENNLAQSQRKFYNFNSVHNNKLVLHYLSKDAETYTDSITDYSGLAHQATKGSGVSISTSTPILTDNSFSFDGTENGILTADGASLSGLGFPFKGIPGSTSRTYCGWVYLNSLASRNPLLSYGSNNYNRGLFDVFIDTDGRMAVSLDIGTNYYIKFAQVFSTGQWYYLALVVDTYNFDITNIRKSFKAYYRTYIARPRSSTPLLENTFYDEYSLLDSLNNDPDLFIHLPLDNVFNHSGDGEYYTKNLVNTNGIYSRLINMSNTLSTNSVNLNNKPVIDFDGANDYLQLPSLYKSSIEDGFTFCGWVNFNSLGAWIEVFRFNNGGLLVHLALYGYDTSRFRFAFYQNKSTPYFAVYSNSGTVTANVWIHVCVSFKKSNFLKIYINGVINATTTGNNVLPLTTSSSTIYNSFYIGEGYFTGSTNGQMYDLRWYSRVLTASEIQAIYNQGKPMFNTDATTNNLLIGKGITGSLNELAYFNGFMNDIRLYSRALDITELEYIWNNGSGSYTRGSNLDNSLLLPITSGSNIVLNSRKLMNITHETLFDNSSKIVLQNSNMWLWNDLYMDNIVANYSNYENHYLTRTISNGYSNNIKIDKIYKINRNIWFDGVDDYLSCIGNYPENFFNNGFSSSGFFRISDFINYMRIFQFDNVVNADTYAIMLFIANSGNLGNLSFVIKNNNSEIISNYTSYILNLNTTYHYSVSLNIEDLGGGNYNYTTKIYINGVLISTEIILNSTTAMYTGNRTQSHIGIRKGGAYDFKGFLSDIRFYSRVLTDNDVWNLYQNRASNGFDLHNTTMCDFYPLSITDTIHTTSQATQKLKSIIDLDHYQPTASTTTSNLSLSTWVYPRTLHSGTLLANSRNNNNKSTNDFRIGIDPIEYPELELHLLGQNHTLSGNIVSTIYDTSKNNKTISFSNINIIDSNYSYETFDFNDSNSNISISSLESSIFQGGFTFTTWFKYTTDFTSSNAVIFHFSNPTLGNTSNIFLGGSITDIFDLQLSVGTTDVVIPNYLVNLNSDWTHLALVFNSNYDAKIYKNGDLFYSNTTAFSSITDTLRTDNYIGAGYYANEYEFEGQMNDIRLYSRSMTQDEIIRIYKQEEQLTFTNFTSSSTYTIHTSNVYLDKSSWTHIGLNYSNTIGKIEFYENSQIKTTLSSSDITIPQLNTSNLSIGTNQDSGLNKNVLNADLCDIIVKPNQITYAETFEEIFNMEHKLLLDIQTGHTTQKYNNLVDNKYFLYDNANYYKYNSNHNSNYQLFHNLEITDVGIITDNDFDYVMNFTGSTQYIKITGPVSTEPLINYNISFWINLLQTKTNNSEFVIISKWIDANFFKVSINYYTSQLKIYYEDSLDASYNFTSYITKGLWQHISINFHNRVGVFLYVNGEFIHQDANDIKFKEDKQIDTGDNNTIKYNSSNVYIGYTNNTAFEGKIADIKIYDGILNPYAIKNLYNKSRKLESDITNKSIFNTTNANYVNDYDVDLSSNCVLHLNTNLITGYDANNYQLTSNIIIDNSQNQNDLYVSNNAYTTISTTALNSTITQTINLDNSSDINNAYIYLDYPIFTNVDNFTFTCWFNSNSFNTDNSYRYLMYNGGINVDDGYGIVFLNSNLKVILDYDNPLVDSISVLDNVSTDTWYHLSYSRDDTNNHIHINGEYLDFTTNKTQAPYNPAKSAFSIGCILNHYLDTGNTTISPLYKFDGKIADVRVYDTCLSNSQIELLAKGTPKYNHYKNEITFSTANKQTYKNKLITSRYTIDAEGNHDGVLPVISRDNMLVHYDFNSLDLTSNPNLVLDINDQHKSDLVYRNPSFINKRQGYTNYHGSMSNITISSPGYINSNCAVFNGANSWISVADGANLDTNSGKQWTINYWIKPDLISFNSNIGVLFCKSNVGTFTSGAFKQYIDISDYNTLKLEIAGVSVFNTNKVISDNKWQMMTTSFGYDDGSSNIMTMYLDGVELFKYQYNDLIIPVPSTDDIIRFGVDNVGATLSNLFTGSIDNIQIWDTKLLDGEIQRLYNKKNTIGPLHYWNPDTAYQFHPEIEHFSVENLGISNERLTCSNINAISNNNGIINTNVFNLSGSNTCIKTAENKIINEEGKYLYLVNDNIYKDNPRTYSFWVKLNDTVNNDIILFIYGKDTDNIFKCYVDINYAIKIKVGSAILYTSNNVLTLNNWYNIVITVYSNKFYDTNGVGDTRNIRLFVNARYIKLTNDGSNTQINTLLNNATSKYLSLGVEMPYFQGDEIGNRTYWLVYNFTRLHTDAPMDKFQIQRLLFYDDPDDEYSNGDDYYGDGYINSNSTIITANNANVLNSTRFYHDAGGSGGDERDYNLWVKLTDYRLLSKYQLQTAFDSATWRNRHPKEWSVYYTENSDLLPGLVFYNYNTGNTFQVNKFLETKDTGLYDVSTVRYSSSETITNNKVLPSNTTYWYYDWPDRLKYKGKYNYNFSIDDIRIYNTTLAIDEIQNIFNNSRNYKIVQLD